VVRFLIACRHSLWTNSRPSHAKRRKIAMEKLAVDLDPKVADLFPAELSGGMKKRVALARAIATNGGDGKVL